MQEQNKSLSPAVIREQGLRSFWIICQSEWNIDREKIIEGLSGTTEKYWKRAL